MILAALIPLDDRRPGRRRRLDGLKEPDRESRLGEAVLHAWRARPRATSTNPLGALWIRIVFGLGFVLSFGYWTTNFAEVQRALSAQDLSAPRGARR